jgi:hypothetical protein
VTTQLVEATQSFLSPFPRKRHGVALPIKGDTTLYSSCEPSAASCVTVRESFDDWGDLGLSLRI